MFNFSWSIKKSLVEEIREYIFKSSAKFGKWVFSRIDERPLIIKINKKGDKCLPWGVPDDTNVDFDTNP